MQNVAILKEEVHKLQAANKRVKKKREKKRLYVGRGGVLTAQEVQEAQNQPKPIAKTPIQVVEEPGSQVPTRAPHKCSVCRSVEHTACTCPER